MSRKKHYRRPDKEVPEMDITTFLNLMVVLVPFLLITAVFSRITILELNLPTSSGSSAPTDVKLNIEVIVRADALQIGNGRQVLISFPKVEDAYDFAQLSKYLLEIKRKFPDKTDATVLMEPDIEYGLLVYVMDAMRVAEITIDDQPIPEKYELFPDISIGDAP